MTDCEFKVGEQQTDLLIVGSSITALMTASFLKQENPALDIVVLGPRPEEENRPLVGESLIEPSTLFFYKLGFGEYVEREHFLKHLLGYYHKLRPEDPNDRRYSFHATDGLMHLSRQLHRPRLDCDLREHAKSLAVRFLPGKAVSYKKSSTRGSDALQHEVAFMRAIDSSPWAAVGSLTRRDVTAGWANSSQPTSVRPPCSGVASGFTSQTSSRSSTRLKRLSESRCPTTGGK